MRFLAWAGNRAGLFLRSRIIALAATVGCTYQLIPCSYLVARAITCAAGSLTT